MAKDSTKVKERKHFMSQDDIQKMGDLERSHKNCLEKTGRMRPGKSKKDRVLKGL